MSETRHYGVARVGGGPPGSAAASLPARERRED